MIGSAETGNSDLLHRLQSITDAALSRLSLPDLLSELLERLRRLLEVDTATVLLLDVHAQQLVATASKGLEAEVRHGFRLSVGRGFAGQVAQGRRPVVLDDAGTAELVSPYLRAKGVRSLAGVPIHAGGQLVGVLHVGSIQPRRFTPEDVHLLELVADRVSLAVRAEGNLIDHTAALALQRGLLPTRLPDLPGVELAARYVPGHDAGVGGDWYDVFTLPEGWLGVVVGDVSGHGLPSAVVMGRLRSALRAYALVCADPADALTHLDKKVHHFEAGNMATVLYAMITPDRTRIHVSLAGHLPPLLCHPDGRVELISVPVDRPLGTGRPAAGRRHSVLDFPRGAALVCYTDGLVERRGEIIDAGLERLRAAVVPGSAEGICATIMRVLGDRQTTDDIALLAVHRAGALPEG